MEGSINNIDLKIICKNNKKLHTKGHYCLGCRIYPNNKLIGNGCGYKPFFNILEQQKN
jgi:hypothetical protein